MPIQPVSRSVAALLVVCSLALSEAAEAGGEEAEAEEPDDEEDFVPGPYGSGHDAWMR